MITKDAEKIVDKKTTRPPIVVVLGHVDHGKSSLLEAIREDFKITSKESGGITQHIGAYQAEVPGGQTITFIDTPGHEIFSAMRQRGAKVADIAVLVVAADESVKPQTVEAIEQIKKAGIPMVVAINKIDKPEANPQRVKQELSLHGVMVESYGGDVPSVETSATTKHGIKELLEMILLVAEIEDLAVQEDQPGQGVIVESFMDAKRGPIATVLVQDGVVKLGDFIGTAFAGGKVRILEDFQGKSIGRAVPSMPAIVGFSKAPRVGDRFSVFKDEGSLKAHMQEEKHEEKANVVTLDPEARVVNIIVKADVAGSLEALEDVLRNLPQGEVALRVVASGVGEVLETDVKLARSARANIFSFRTKVTTAALDVAEKAGVSIQKFDVVYELIQAVRELMDQAAKEEQGGRKDVGSLLVLAVFLVDKKRQVIGGKVLEGEVHKGVSAEVVRRLEVVGQGRITNVQRDKKDVPIAGKNQECGLSYEGAEKIQAGDTLQFYIEKSQPS